MHSDLHTDLDNLDSVENNLRHSAKGSNDGYDVTFSLTFWIRQPKHKWPKSWSSMEDPVVPLERNLYGHPLAGPIW